MTGEGARIRIRGNASLSQSNEPIIFVDGVRINSSGDSASTSEPAAAARRRASTTSIPCRSSASRC